MAEARSFPLPDAFAVDVVVYLTPWCALCLRAKRLLGARGIPFETFDVSGNSDARRWLVESTGQHTVPQIFIKGRSKLLIEVSGYKIDPIEVEDALAAHPAIAESAVAGIPDPRSGNRLRAYVVRRSDVSEDEIIRHVRARLSVQKVPAEIAFLDALPKSPTGKILRARLKDF